MRRFLLCAMLLLSFAAPASETGYATRDLEMRAEPKADAPVVGSLAKGARFELLKRQMSWAQVSAEGRQGWVLFFYLMAGEPPKPAGGAALAEAWTLGTQRAAQSDRITATIGVRGIDEEQLRSARFNAEELKRLEAFTVPAQAGESFAHEVALSRRSVSYLGQ